jgi:hypothetical protein
MPAFKSVMKVEDAIKQDVVSLLGKFSKQLNYKGPNNFADRVSVWADVHKFNHKLDEYVWNQKKGDEMMHFSIYFDGVFICSWNGEMTETEANQKFWKGFLSAYEKDNDSRDKVFLVQENYEVINQEKKEKDKQQKEEIIKAIKDRPVKTEVQAQAKEIALDVAQDTSDSAN